MDLIFALAVTNTGVFLENESIAVVLGKDNIQIPIMHYRVHNKKELDKLWENLHKRMDAVVIEEKNHWSYNKTTDTIL